MKEIKKLYKEESEYEEERNLSFGIIVAATDGDKEAIKKAFDFYDGYISKLSLRKMYDDYGNKDPAQITFVYKTGFKSSINGDQFKPQRKDVIGRHKTDELCSDNSYDTCGVLS